MKIKKDSWHYSIISRYLGTGRDCHNNLCSYVHQLIKAMAIMGSVISLLTFWVSITLLGLYAIVDLYIINGLPFINDEVGLINFSICMGYAILILTIILGLVFLYNKIDDWWDSYKRKRFILRLERKKAKEPTTNLLVEWLKAKKDKVCPMIEYE